MVLPGPKKDPLGVAHPACRGQAFTPPLPCPFKVGSIRASAAGGRRTAGGGSDSIRSSVALPVIFSGAWRGVLLACAVCGSSLGRRRLGEQVCPSLACGGTGTHHSLPLLSIRWGDHRWGSWVCFREFVEAASLRRGKGDRVGPNLWSACSSMNFHRSPSLPRPFLSP